MQPEDFSQEIEIFQREAGREYYYHFSGHKTTLDIRSHFDRLSDWLRPEWISELRKTFSSTPQFFEMKRLIIRIQIEWAEQRALEFAALVPLIIRHEQEARTLIRLDEEEIPARRLTDRICAESSLKTRQALNSARLEFLNKNNPYDAECFQHFYEATRRFESEGYLKTVTNWIGQEAWATYRREFDRFLEQTASVYLKLLSESTNAYQPNRPIDVLQVDVLFRFWPFLDSFIPTLVPEVGAQLLAEMRVDAHRQAMLHIDAVARPHKDSRPQCFPLTVPGEIKAVLPPVGSPVDYLRLFQLVGEALHYAWTSDRLQPELRFGGDESLNLASGLLFRHLIRDPLWLDDFFHTSERSDFIKLAWLEEAYAIRKAIGLLDFELRLHNSEDPSQSGEFYTQALKRTTYIRHAPESALDDLEIGLRPLIELRARLLECQLSETLRIRYGRRWWKSSKALDFLIDLWNTGRRYTAEELANLADLGPLSVDALTQEVLEHLR